MVKIANLRCGNERNSKTKYSTATKFAPVCNNDSSYKTMKNFFKNHVAFLNYVAKTSDWSVPGYRGNRRKNPASWFCAYCPYITIPQIWLLCGI